MRGLPPVAESRDHSSSRCAGLSPLLPLLLWSTGSRCAGSVVVAHGLSRSAACGIFPDQGSNPCPLHWQADSQPLRHQGSPQFTFCKGNWFFLRLLLRRNILYPVTLLHKGSWQTSEETLIQGQSAFRWAVDYVLYALSQKAYVCHYPSPTFLLSNKRR